MTTHSLSRESEYFLLGERLIALLWCRYHHSGLGDATPSALLMQHRVSPRACSIGQQQFTILG